MQSPKTLARKPPIPFFALLESPYGMSFVVIGTLPLYVLHAQGLSLEKAAAISAFCTTPATLYFLSSPVVDFLCGGEAGIFWRWVASSC